VLMKTILICMRRNDNHSHGACILGVDERESKRLA
jgi:hypothetical protein